jgi:5'-nucleotidase
MRATCLLVSFALVSGFSFAQEPMSPVHVVIVATADVHGHVEEREEAVMKPGEGRIRWGGLAVFGGELANLRAEEPGRVVWLDAGDEFQGTLISNLSEGEAVARAFDALGLVAAAVGNHEFDFGPLGPDTVVRHEGQDPLGAIKRNAALVRYPFLSANLLEKATGRTPAWARPSTILKVAGVKVGILGLSTPTTPTVTNPLNVRSLLFTDPLKATVETAKALRAAGADAVIALAHIGGGCREGEETDLSGCDVNSEEFRLLRSLPPGTIDLFLGGHTHRSVRKIVGGVPVTQASADGQAFAVVDLYVDPQAHRVLSDHTVLRRHEPVCAVVYAGRRDCDPRHAPAGPVTTVPARFAGRPVQRDARIDAILEPFREKVAVLKSQPLGVKLAAPFTKAGDGEWTIGDLLTDALRDASGADIVLLNNGGIRAELRALVPAYGDLFEVYPFDNFQATARLTPAHLRALLSGNGSDHPATYQVSGIRAVVDLTVMPATVTLTSADGRPLDESRRYLVATSDFLVAEGGGLSKIFTPDTEPKVLYGAPLQRDAIAEVLKKWSASGEPLEPRTDGRLLIKRPPRGEARPGDRTPQGER